MKNKTFEELLELEKNNDNEARYELARRYYYGNEIAQNYEKAFNLYLKASENGNIDAKYMVAFCLYSGKGTNVFVK